MSEVLNSIHIHFVCTGNTFRSRLAEALLKSNEIKNIEVSSSGVDAKADYDGPITWYGSRLAYRYGLLPFLKPYWTNTTAELLNAADLVIFMSKTHCEHCLHTLKSTIKSYEIWDIPDIADLVPGGTTYSHKDDLAYIDASEIIFVSIQTKMNDLVEKLQKK